MESAPQFRYLVTYHEEVTAGSAEEAAAWVALAFVRKGPIELSVTRGSDGTVFIRVAPDGAATRIA